MVERKIDIPARDARQGEIILKHRTSRVVFIAALAGIVLVALLSGLLAI